MRLRNERVGQLVREASGVDVVVSQVVGPVLHELSAALEEIAPPVDSLHAVAVDVRQGEFTDLSRHLGPLRGPVPKAGP